MALADDAVRPGADPARLRDVQDRALRTIIGRVAADHPFYRDLWAEHGVDPRAVRGVEDLPLLPLTTKSMFTAAPQRFRLQPDGSPERQLWDIAYTSGSTSAPAPIYQSAYDFHAILAAQVRMAEIRGMRGDDRIANLYPLTPQPHGAWTRANHAAAVLGATVVCGMSGVSPWFGVTRRLGEVAGLLVRTRPTVLWGVPSYVRRVVDEVARRGGTLPDVRMLALSGEATTAPMAAQLKDLLACVGAPDVVVSNSLGASELQYGLVECAPGAGFHNPVPELLHLDAVDDRGRPVPPGTPGAFTMTHLDRHGTVLVRYLLGDRVEVDHDPCPRCGRLGGRVVAHHGRAGGSLKIKGQLVDTTVLETTVATVSGVVDHRAVVRRSDPADPLSGDELVVQVALAPATERGVTEQVSAAVKLATRVTPMVEVTTLDALFPADERMKPRRFVDERQRQESPA
ncbi:phenylacetate--CoA ligase family protein [Micromonospora globbae]|uniref:phenylacetate--CoA ligase family protein n=1 Tax=Micromonospora globbae TaxID=1894969 RepID=UPI003449A58E